MTSLSTRIWLAVLLYFSVVVAERSTKVDFGEEPKDEEVVEQAPTGEQEMLTPESTGVECEQLVYWWRKRRVQSTPPEVQSMMDSFGLSELHRQMIKAVLGIGRRSFQRWNITGVHAALWNKGWESKFNAKGVALLLRKQDKIAGPKTSLCYVNTTLHPDPQLDFAYSDAVNGRGKMLPKGVVAILMKPPYRSDGTRGKTLKFEEDETTDLQKFLTVKELLTEHNEFRDHFMKAELNTARDPVDLAMELLARQKSWEPRFMKKNVKIHACYRKYQTFPWNWTMIKQIQRATRYQYWFEYVDMKAQPDYVPSTAILQERQCDRLPIEKGKISLEMRAMTEQYNLVSEYNLLHRAIRLKIREVGQDKNVVKALYHLMWDKGFENDFKEHGLTLYMEGQGNVGKSADEYSDSTMYLCYVNSKLLDKDGKHKVDENKYRDAKSVATNVQNLWVLGKGVYGEELKEIGTKMVFGDTPVDVKRLLTEKGAADLHGKLWRMLIDAPPSKISVPTFEVYKEVKELRMDFAAKGVGLWVCSVTHTFERAGNQGFAYFSWIEYVDLEQRAEYIPEHHVTYDSDAEVIPITPQARYSGAGPAAVAASWALVFCASLGLIQAFDF